VLLRPIFKHFAPLASAWFSQMPLFSSPWNLQVFEVTAGNAPLFA
jgi:hypothetical protein